MGPGWLWAFCAPWPIGTFLVKRTTISDGTVHSGNKSRSVDAPSGCVGTRLASNHHTEFIQRNPQLPRTDTSAAVHTSKFVCVAVRAVVCVCALRGPCECRTCEFSLFNWLTSGSSLTTA